MTLGFLINLLDVFEVKTPSEYSSCHDSGVFSLQKPRQNLTPPLLGHVAMDTNSSHMGTSLEERNPLKEEEREKKIGEGLTLFIASASSRVPAFELTKMTTGGL